MSSTTPGSKLTVDTTPGGYRGGCTAHDAVRHDHAQAGRGRQGAHRRGLGGRPSLGPEGAPPSSPDTAGGHDDGVTIPFRSSRPTCVATIDADTAWDELG